MFLWSPTHVQTWITYDFAGHGWLADWIAGVGQGIGALGTLWAVWVALAAERKAEGRRRQDVLDRELAAARLVSVHVTVHRQSIPPGPRYCKVVLRNDSPTVVVSARLVDITVDGGQIPRWRVRTDSGITTGQPGFKSEEVPWLEPGKAGQWVVDGLDAEDNVISIPESKDLEVFVRFERDGWSWARSNRGLVEKMFPQEWDR